MDEDDEAAPETDDEVREAIRAIRGGDATLRHVLVLVNASFERTAPVAPAALVDAVAAKFECDRDFANGGADQFAWNHGAAPTRAVAAAFRAVGAIENADLLDRLARELDAYRAEVSDADVSADPVRRFLEYRRRVNGPFFSVPEPDEELAEALVEHAIAHASELPDPDGPLPAVSEDPPQ